MTLICALPPPFYLPFGISLLRSLLGGNFLRIFEFIAVRRKEEFIFEFSVVGTHIRHHLLCPRAVRSVPLPPPILAKCMGGCLVYRALWANKPPENGHKTENKKGEMSALEVQRIQLVPLIYLRKVDEINLAISIFA